MWWDIIIYIFAVYIIYQIDKRIKHLEEVQQGKGWSQRFTVEATEALTKHKKFGELTGIKSAIEGKDFKDWTKDDKDKWHKFYKENENQISQSRVFITYLDSENAYFVNTLNGNPYISFSNNKTNCIFSARVLGDKDGFKPHIEFLIYVRQIKQTNGKYNWFLIPCFQYREGFMAGNNTFDILFEYPLFDETSNDEKLKKLGFEIERNSGDFFTNSFGEYESSSTFLSYSKNGASIDKVF